MQKFQNHIYLIVLLAALSSVAPMGVDTYIPSIPDIAKSFEVSIEKIELSLSIFLIGFSLGQVAGGPISDNYGRKKSSILGLIGYAFFSFIIIFSTHIYELWAYRFLEAFFGGIVVVNATATVRDRFHGKEAAKVFSLIGTIRSVAPLIAPAIGAFIIHFFPWQAIFIFLTLYAFVMIIWISFALDESFTKTKQSIIKSFLIVLSHKQAIKVMLTLALCFSGFFILIAKSSFIYIEHFKVSTDYFPFFFGFNFFILIILTRLNVSLLKKYEEVTLVNFAILVQIVSGTIFTLFHDNLTLFTTLILIATYMSMMAFVFGNCITLALEYFSKNAGVASSVLGVLQFGLGAIISSIALSFHSNSFLPIGLSITLISSLALLLFKTYKT